MINISDKVIDKVWGNILIPLSGGRSSSNVLPKHFYFYSPREGGTWIGEIMLRVAHSVSPKEWR